MMDIIIHVLRIYETNNDVSFQIFINMQVYYKTYYVDPILRIESLNAYNLILVKLETNFHKLLQKKEHILCRS